MQAGQKINPKNLKAMCWARGLTVTALAARVRKSRQNVYKAVHNPSRFPRVFAAVSAELLA